MDSTLSFLHNGLISEYCLDIWLLIYVASRWTNITRGRGLSYSWLIWFPLSWIYLIISTKNWKIAPSCDSYLSIEFRCIKYTMHCILYIVLYALCSMHCIQCIDFQCIFIQCLLFNALYSMHCILCIILCALYSTLSCVNCEEKKKTNVGDV